MNYLFKFLKKMKSPKIFSFRKSKNTEIQKVDFFFEKSMLPLKELRIFLRSFPLLNDKDRSDSVFFGNGRRTYVIERSESERSEVRAKRGSSYRGGLPPPPGCRLRRYGRAATGGRTYPKKSAELAGRRKQLFHKCYKLLTNVEKSRYGP